LPEGAVALKQEARRMGGAKRPGKNWFQPDYKAQLNVGQIAAAFWLILSGRRGLPLCRRSVTTMTALSSKIAQLE